MSALTDYVWRLACDMNEAYRISAEVQDVLRQVAREDRWRAQNQEQADWDAMREAEALAEENRNLRADGFPEREEN